MPERRAKDALFDGFAEVPKALASGRRLEILDVLDQGERSVEDVAGATALSVANASHHLRTLARAGLVRTRRDGTRIFYSLASERVSALWDALREVAAEHVAEVDRLADAFLGDRSGFEPVSKSELMRRIKRGDVTVLDVRPEVEYAAGHVLGARSVPLAALQRRLRTLPKDREIVAYCRGPYCVFADEAVRLLRAKGYRATRMEDGFPEWRRAGLPMAAGKEA